MKMNHTVLCTDASLVLELSCLLCKRINHWWCTMYTYLTEQQLAAMCSQLRCLPVSNRMHEGFIRDGEPLWPGHLHVHSNTQQIHQKPLEIDIYSTFLTSVHTHIDAAGWPGRHRDHLSTWGLKAFKPLCFQVSAENALERDICPLQDPCVQFNRRSDLPVEGAYMNRTFHIGKHWEKIQWFTTCVLFSKLSLS